METLADSAYWQRTATQLLSLGAIAYLSGLLATSGGVKVNYTRKINHFAIFFLPIFLADVFPYQSTLESNIVSGIIYAGMLAVLTKPVRKRVGFIRTVFASFDRPEDRPHTMLWLTTQIVAGYSVLIPLGYFLSAMDAPRLIYIPILVNAIGDGLAEPVGVRWGKHTYEVRALTSGRSYTRTIEGSLCVLVTAVLVVLLFRGSFEAAEFWTALIIIPPAMTLAEARAPHTRDTPFLFMIGGLILLAIVAWV
jgi:dolichol kinase